MGYFGHNIYVVKICHCDIDPKLNQPADPYSARTFMTK